MKIYRIFILFVSLSNSLANNKDKIIPENFKNWLNSFNKDSYSNIGLASSSSSSSSSSDDNDYYSNNKKFYQRENPIVIIDSPDDIDYNENSMMNYKIQSPSSYLMHSANPRDVSSRLSYKTHAHKGVFQSLCPTKSQIFILSDPDFEYRPDRYQNVTCNNPIEQSSSTQDNDDNNVCDQIGFKCVQHRRTMLLNIRKNGSDCWKKKTIVVDSGCECVMPV